MVIFLDIKKRCVKVYSESGTRTIDFDNIRLLNDIIGNGKALYVLKADTVSAKQIIETVESIRGQIKQQNMDSGEVMFVRNGTFGALTIPGIYNKLTKISEDVIFKNSTDAKVLKDFHRDYGKDIFETSPVMRNLLKNGKLQIVSESELNEVNHRIKTGKLKKFNSVAESRAAIKKHIKTISKEESEEEINLGIMSGGPSSRGGAPSNFGNEKVIIDETGDIMQEGRSNAAGFLDDFLGRHGVLDD